MPAAFSDPARVAHESRRWSTFAHLSVFAFSFIPFGGVFAAGLIYSMRTEDSPLAREHERRALNFCLLVAVLQLLAAFAYLPFVLSFFVTMTRMSSMPASDAPPPAFVHSFEALFEVFGCFAVAFLTIGTLAGIGAWRAWQGKAYGYVVSLPVVRPRR